MEAYSNGGLFRPDAPSGGAPRLGRFRGVRTLVTPFAPRTSTSMSNALARRAPPPEDVNPFVQQRCVLLPGTQPPATASPSELPLGSVDVSQVVGASYAMY